METYISELGDIVAIGLWFICFLMILSIITESIRKALSHNRQSVQVIDTNDMELVSREETNGVIEEVYIKGNRKV
ncbi:hypothetical protein, partial [Mycobacterium tuberculosis]